MKMQPARLWRYNRERKKYLGKVGKLVGWSQVQVGPEGMERRAPYFIGLIRVGGETVIAQLVEVEAESIKRGMMMVGRLRRLFDVPKDQLIVYGVKFAPLREK